MKKSIALLVMTVFLVGMMPSVLAQANSGQAPPVSTLNVATVTSGNIVHSGNIQVRGERTMKLRAEIRDTQRRERVRADIAHLRALSVWDEDASQKALHTLHHALNVIEVLDLNLVKLAERIENSDEFQKTHPNALTRVENIKKELSTMYRTLTVIVSDDEVTKKEWTEAVPILKKLHIKLRSLNNPDFRDLRRDHVLDFAERMRERYGTIRERLRDKGLSDNQVENRIANIEQALEQLESNAVRHEKIDKTNFERIRSSLT